MGAVLGDMTRFALLPAVLALVACACAYAVPTDVQLPAPATGPAPVVLDPLAWPVPAPEPVLTAAVFADADLALPATPVVAPEPAPPPAPPPEPALAAEIEPEPVPLVQTFTVTGRGDYANANRAARKPDETLTAALREALDRWTAATCVPFEVLPEGGQHRVQYATPDELPGTRVGQVTGQWAAALVQASDFVRYGAVQKIMVHELGHLLSQDNGHSSDGVLSADLFADGNDAITAASLTQVCARLECVCFAPEAQ